MAARLQTQEGLTHAVKLMQRFAGIQETGLLDERTLQMMRRPRCSLPDIIGTSELMRRRRRRYALSGNVWSKKALTWRIRSFPSSQSLPRDHIRNLLYFALRAWSNVSALSFHEAPSGSADILVDFSRSYHDDGYPFDGPGGTLAHAFFPGEHPISGDTHFDDEETWIYDPQNAAQGTGTDLFAVAVHEFGHAVGLSHSSARGSIMLPYYQGPVGWPHQYQLPPDDVLGVEQLYGRPDPGLSPSEGPPLFPIPTEPPVPPLSPQRPTRGPRPLAPDRCEANFDAIANIRGEVFFFKSEFSLSNPHPPSWGLP
uniref:Peptidase metallopeptidase domain-containing protein n=1 Tax=Sphenodon punctatus TaxID=8508 RepID=A0A8D0L7X6_SPHPU